MVFAALRKVATIPFRPILKEGSLDYKVLFPLHLNLIRCTLRGSLLPLGEQFSVVNT